MQASSPNAGLLHCQATLCCVNLPVPVVLSMSCGQLYDTSRLFDLVGLYVLQADLVPESDLKRMKALLRCLNTEAEIVVTKESRLDPNAVLGTGLFSLEKAARAAGWLKVLLLSCHVIHATATMLCSFPCKLKGLKWLVLCQTLQEGETVEPETEEYGIGSFVYRARRPFHPERLHAFITSHLLLQEPDWSDALASEDGECSAASCRSLCPLCSFLFLCLAVLVPGHLPCDDLLRAVQGSVTLITAMERTAAAMTTVTIIVTAISPDRMQQDPPHLRQASLLGASPTTARKRQRSDRSSSSLPLAKSCAPKYAATLLSKRILSPARMQLQ